MPFRYLTLALLVAFAAPTVLAQNPAPQSDRADADTGSHELTILEGKVYLDGRPLPPENLPDGLDLTGIPPYSYSFTWPLKPVLEIDGVVYVLQDEQLRILAETDLADSQVYFLGEPDLERAAAPPPPEMSEPQLARMSEAAYLQQLSSRDRSLYDQIRTEQALERETLRLALQIKRSTNEDERSRLEGALRRMLDESFELKQGIRADEIEQAEAQIIELRRLLGERQARKAQIIERRVRELIGGR